MYLAYIYYYSGVPRSSDASATIRKEDFGFQILLYHKMILLENG
jgi:hypothetical protein